MRFKKYLTELSAKLQAYRVWDETGARFSTWFKTDNHEFEFWAVRATGADDEWVIAFNRNDKEEWASGSVTTIRRFQVMDDMPQKEVIQAFAGVQKSLEYFIKKYKPKAFEFDAEDSRHMKLYDSLSKIIERKSGYTLSTKMTRFKVYRFVKHDLSKLKIEAYEKGFNTYAGYVEIFVNPSKKEMKEAAHGEKVIRFIADGRIRKVWVWNVNILHDQAWKELGRGGTYFSGNMLAGEAEQRGSSWVMYTATSLVDKEKYDWSWLEKTIEVTDYIRSTSNAYRKAGVMS